MADPIFATPAPDPLDALLLGPSPAIQRVRREIRALAGTRFRCVLVQGETGVGKSLVAQGLAACSPHRDDHVEVFDCVAFATQHLESEFFGTARNAYPGAQDRPGVPERAGGGLLQLDEVSGLPLTAQGRILQLVERGETRRLGAMRSVPLGAAILATTHQDLPALVEQGRFREDLFYRLVEDGVVQMPALRERQGDIPVLVATFAAELALPVRFTDAALETLQAQAWPGNVRQLRAVTRAAAWLAESGAVGSECVERALARLAPRAGRSVERPRAGMASFQAATSELRRCMLVDALAAAGGNQTRAGILLGLHEPRHAGESVLNLQARKLAHRKFRYWWTRLVDASSGDVPIAARGR